MKRGTECGIPDTLSIASLEQQKKVKMGKRLYTSWCTSNIKYAQVLRELMEP